MFIRPTKLTFRDYFVSTEDEIDEDYKWVSTRNSSDPSVAGSSSASSSDVAGRYEGALHKYEHDFLVEYRKRWPNRCYQLNQNPAKHAHKSRDDGELHTIIRNCHILFADGPNMNRALTPQEVLIAQGFPLNEELSKIATGCQPCCSFELQRERSRNEMMMQAGNSININMIGAAQLFLLGFVRRSDFFLP